MHIQVKMTLVEKCDDEDLDIDVSKELTFSTLEDADDVNITLYDEDTSDMIEVNVAKNELIKVLSVLQAASGSNENECCGHCEDDDDEEDEILEDANDEEFEE